MVFRRLRRRIVLEVRDELMRRADSVYMEPLEKHVVAAMLVCVTTLIERLLLSRSPESVNYFRKPSNRPDRGRIFILFRLLIRYFLAFFMVNKDTKKMLSFGNIPEEHMRNVVSKVFGCEECEETALLQVEQMIRKEKYGKAWSLMNQYIFKRVFGVEEDESASIFGETFFVESFSAGYEIFLEALSNVINQRIDAGTELKKQLEGFEEK